MVKRVFLVICLLFPIATWAFYKPVRVLAPELVSGITCESETICLDDTSRFVEAAKLYDEAILFVSSTVGEIQKKPRIIFCTNESCFNSFGFDKATAHAVGTSGIVISPRGWKYFYVRHEIIHHVQAEKMGVISQWLSPAWFKEGMAYSLSEDPRRTLPEPNQEYREKFAQWYGKIGKDRLWDASLKP